MSIQMQPLFWRISDQNSNGRGAVSLLMPTHMGSRTATELPMNLSFLALKTHQGPKDVCWSEDDVELFMALLQQKRQQQLDGDIELDLNDRAVHGIIQLVALARFQTASTVALGKDINTVRDELEVGSLVAINTTEGWPLAVVVAQDSIEASCILIEPLHAPQHALPEGSLVVIPRLAALPAQFANSSTAQEAVRH